MTTTGNYEAIRRELDPAKLMREAQEEAGLSDYGNLEFAAPLTRLLDRAAREVNFTPEGLAAYRKHNIVRFLVNRLRAEEDFKRHPEIFDEDVSDPIIVIGLPRSGTTKMQRIIASAPGLQKPVLWKLVNPAPFPNAIPGQRDPRVAAAAVAFGFTEELNAGHLVAYEEAEEEILLFDFAFDDSVNGYSNYLPLFFTDDWLAQKPNRVPYRYVKKLLQYLQWQDGGKRNRPWVLKAVIHIAHMDALLECFPKATLVHSHRDPRSSVPSMAKLMSVVWGMKTHPVDSKFAGQGFLKWGSIAINRYLEARQRLGLDSRILDVKYEQVRDDPLSIMQQVYQHAGREWTPKVEQCALEWSRNNVEGQHGKHNYSLEGFGLSEAMVDQAFEKYIRRFIDR